MISKVSAQKRKVPFHYIFKPDKMSGFFYHVILVISILTCALFMAVLSLGFEASESFYILSTFSFYLGAFCVFLVAMLIYNSIPRFARFITRFICNSLFTLVYLAAFCFFPFAAFAMTEGAILNGAIFGAIFSMAIVSFLPGAVVVLICGNIISYRRYVNAAKSHTDLFSRVNEYLLQKYPCEEFLKAEKNYSVSYAKLKRRRAGTLVHYDDYSRFEPFYRENKSFPFHQNRRHLSSSNNYGYHPKTSGFLLFPKNACDNCVVDITFPTPTEAEEIRSDVFGEQMPLSGFSVYINNGEFSDDLPEYVKHNQAMNAFKPDIMRYLTEKYPNTLFDILTVNSYWLVFSGRIWLPRIWMSGEQHGICNNLNHDIGAIVVSKSEIDKDYEFIFYVARIHDEFSDTFDKELGSMDMS